MRREAEAANKEAREKTQEAERRLAEIRAGGGDAESVTTQQLRLAEAKLRELKRVEATLEATTRPPAKLHVGRGDASVEERRSLATPSRRRSSSDRRRSGSWSEWPEGRKAAAARRASSRRRPPETPPKKKPRRFRPKKILAKLMGTHTPSA